MCTQAEVGIRTTTSFASADVTRLSSQYSQPPRDAINAVSVKTRISQRHRSSVLRPLTMSGTQRPKMIRHPIQVVAIWWVLIAWVVGLHR